MKKPSKFDRYFYYLNSVQSPEHDAGLLKRMYQCSFKVSNKTESIVLQEDFCGTAALCYEWVKLSKSFEAVGVDLDEQALKWGRTNHAEDLSEAELERVKVICGDVLSDHKLKPNIICALNFSYFFIKDRIQMVRYFQTAKKSLSSDGLLVLDAFGGPEYLLPHSDRRRVAAHKFTYWWSVEFFDAISNSIRCHLSFKRDGEKIRKNVFTYDWRLWSVPEISDMLMEAGFESVQYWAEGLDRDGHGNGKFRPITSERDCKSWVVYLVARK